ncbi:MAG TPA: FHA domain-containing protein [Herpetosiphonaceae bacterium]
MKKYTCFLLVVIALLSLIPTPPATQAQNEEVPPRVVVMHRVVTERANALDLGVYFTVRDKTGRVVSPEEISQAKILVRSDEPPIDAAPDASETPIKIALVMDASGSMRSFLGDVRPAAIAAINSAPSDAQIAIFSFAKIEPGGSESFFPIVDFTSDRDKLREFINVTYDPQSNAPTCLFSAAFGAINYMNSNLAAEERRAVLLFTDGRDELGAGNPAPCSDKTAQDVIEKAESREGNTPTPIFPVGLCTSGGSCSNLDQNVMKRLADRTNGGFLAGTTAEIADIFNLVMKEITSQKFARATIRPCEEQQVVLQVAVINLGDLEGVIPLGDHKCYAPDATVELNGFTKPEGQNDYNFELEIENPSGADMERIDIEVIGPGNTTVYSQTIDKKVESESSATASVVIPGLQLKQQGKHRVQIQARTPENVLFETRGKDRGNGAVLAQREFDHVPVSSVSMVIESRPAIDYDSDTFRVGDVKIDDPLKSLDAVKDDFVTYQVLLLDGQTALFQSEPANFDPDSPAMVVPISEIQKASPEVVPTEKTRRLSLVVKLNAPNLEVTSPAFSFDFPPAPKVSLFAKYGLYCVAVLLVLLVAAAVVYVVRTRRARPRMIPAPYQPSGYGDRSQGQPVTNSRSAPPPPAPVPPPARGRDDATMVFQPASQAQSQRLRVRVLQTPDLSQKRDEVITTFPHVIGREGNFPIRGDASISRRHAEIFAQGGTFYIRDLESVNGLFVNDVRQEANQPVRIDGRTVVRVGLFTYLELEPK